jgi:hypothetical protein
VLTIEDICYPVRLKEIYDHRNYPSEGPFKSEPGSDVHAARLAYVAPFGVSPIGIKKAFSRALLSQAGAGG